MSSILEEDLVTRAWADKYVADMNFLVTFVDPPATKILAQFNPFLSNIDNNPLKVTGITFQDTINQVGEFNIDIDDSKDHIIDRDIIDNGMFVLIIGARKGFEATTADSMFFGYCEEIVEARGRGPIKQYSINGLSSLGQLQNFLINFNESAVRDSLSSTGFKKDDRFQAWALLRQMFEDDQILPITGGGKLSIGARGHYNTDDIDRHIDQVIPTVNFPVVYASQFVAHVADATGADVYADPFNHIQFHYPNYFENITYLKDYWNKDAPPEESDSAWNTSYVLAPYVRHGSTRPSDGFANYLVGVATTEGNIEISEDKTEGFTDLVRKDIAQQFTAESNQFFYIAFVASKTGGGSHSNTPATDSLRVKIVVDKDDLPLGSNITQFFIKVKNIGAEPTIISPPPSNQQVRVVPGQKYWICWSRMGDSSENTIRIHHDAFSNKAPVNKSATRLVNVDTLTGKEDPRATDQKGGRWFYSASGPTYAHAVATPSSRILLDMADPLSIERWGQVDRKVEATSWINDAKQLGEYMSALLLWSAKKRWIYNFPSVSIPLRPFRAGRPISLRDQVFGVTGVDEVDAYSIIQEVTYTVKASEYALGTNTCSITSLGFQNPLDYTIAY